VARKWNRALEIEALRLDAEGRSVREIAVLLSKRGKSVSHGLVGAKLKAAKERSAKGATLATAVQPASPAVPPELLEPPDTSAMSPEDLVGLLTGVIRQQATLAQTLTAAGDHSGARAAVKVLAQIATSVQKQQARDDADGEVMKIRATDLAAAAERARSKLHDLVARLSEERSR